tara:strand:+ start:745 stop:1251 length:507 start_codon:yes stop_codon:yes gene_type:complete
MAYVQQPGKKKLPNANIAALTNGVGEKTPEQRRKAMNAMNERLKLNRDNAARVVKKEKDANFAPTDVKSGQIFNQGMQGTLRSEMTKNVTKGKNGYYTADIHPEYPKAKGSKGYDAQQVKFEQHNFQANKKANQYNSMINKEKESQGVDVAKEAYKSVSNMMKNFKIM